MRTPSFHTFRAYKSQMQAASSFSGSNRKTKSAQYLLLMAATLTGLSGCTGLPPYIEQETLPSANLRLKVAQPSSFRYCVVAATVNYHTCQPEKVIGAISCSTKLDEKRIGMPGTVPPRDGILERKIPSGELFSIAPYLIFMDIPVGDLIKNPSKYMNIDMGACIVPSFTPETGKNYEMVFSPSPGKCDVNLYEAHENGRLTDISESQSKSVELISNNNNTGALLCEEKSDDWTE